MIVLIILINLFSMVVEKERGIAEATYNSILKAELGKILDEDKFTISVNVELKPDENTLNKYYAEEDDDALPGLTIKNKNIDYQANNNLMSMVSKINVIAVIDSSVEEDKKELIEGIIKNKISLNEARGDSLKISRIKFPSKSNFSSSKTTLFDNKLVLGVGIFLVLFVASFIYLLWQLSLMKADLKSRAKLKAEIEIDSSNVNGGGEKIKLPSSSEDSSTSIDDSFKKEHKKSSSSKRSISDFRDKILNLGVTDANACSSGIRKLISSHDGLMKAAVLVEEIGYDYAKKIFTSLNNTKWNELGKYIKDNIEDIDTTKTFDIMSEAYYLILGESISTNSSTNSMHGFSFDALANLSETELKKLIESESNSNIALIASYYDSEQMVDIIKLLPDSKQQEVVLEIARFEKLPKDLVLKAAENLSSKLKSFQDPNSIEFKGHEYIGNFLNYIDQEQEEKLLTYIENADPALRNSLRKYHFSFEDLKLVPQKYLEPALEEFDSKFLARALNKASNDLVNLITSSLPEKKALMLTDELSVQELISKKEVLNARTKLLNTIKSTLSKFDFDFTKLNQDLEEAKDNYIGAQELDKSSDIDTDFEKAS